MVTAVGNGSAEVRATLQGHSGSAAITVAPLPPFPLREVTVGYGHTCGVAAQGGAYCWGRSDFGQLGGGSTSWPFEQLFPVPVTQGTDFGELSAGTDFTCALSTSARAYCWGVNFSGQNGIGGLPPGGINQAPVPVLDTAKLVTLTTGGTHTCGITLGGDAYCWGSNSTRQLGIDSTTCGAEYYRYCSFVPVPVSGGLKFAAIAAGGSHTCGITTQQLLYCWGDGNALGSDSVGLACTNFDDYYDYTYTFSCSPHPILVRGDLRFTTVSAGYAHSCAITTDGSAYCWGALANDGSLGAGAFTGSATPVMVSGGHHFTMIAAGLSHSCGITSEGVAYCWGAGGALGDSVGVDRAIPIPVAGSVLFQSISAGGWSSCGIARGTTIAYCWGLNQWGQLGDGTTISRLRPVQVVSQESP
jgi:alpha-tubulin suppressor-like RCC1 family protein